MTPKARILVASLSLSMAGFIAIATKEHYVELAMVPTKNDRPTVGLGSTFYEDGSPVRMGDRIKPVRAMVLASNHITKEEVRFRASLPDVAMHQEEYDLYMDWVYQYGTGAWAKSSMRRALLAGNYAGSCKALLLYKWSGGYDCSTLIDGAPNRRCWGVWTRQLERHETCMGAQ